MSTAEPYQISVADLLRSKFGDKTPRLLICLGRKILHEDYLNEVFRL